MKKYIGVLSIVYIIAIILRLKDTQKSFYQYREEFEKMRQQLKTISKRQNPFIMMKFTNFIVYFFLILYYIANLILFDNYLVITIFSYLLIFVGLFKLGRKLSINSVSDFKALAQSTPQEYEKQKRIDFCLGLVEFAYAFNALSLISFYH